MGKNAVTTPSFQTAIDAVEALPPEDQETLIDLIHRRLVERRRDEIARHAAETLEAVREGRAQYGTLEDLERNLAREDIYDDLASQTLAR
jgi:hypothetical protein